MIRLNINNQNYSLPESWDEVIESGKYLHLMAVLCMPFDQEKIKHLALLLLTCIEGKELPDNILVATQLLDEVYPLMDYIFEPSALEVPQMLTRCPIPDFVEGMVRFYGPGDHLAGQSAAEMEEGGWAYAEYIKTGEDKYLAHLIAILYLPEKVDTKKRSALDKETIDDRAKRFDRLTEPYKYGILLWYESCERWWAKTNAKLYEKGTGEAEEVIDSLAIPRLIRSLAGPVRGTVENIRHTMKRDEIYFELQELERERLAIEAARK